MIKYLLEFLLEINPYDVCVVNKTVNWKQITTVFCVYDMKVSHHDHQEIQIFVEWVKQRYEVEGLNKLKSAGGKIHVF